MGQRGNVDNLGYFDACTVDGADCRLTTVAGTLYISLYLAEAQVISNLCTILCCHLGCIGSILF